MTKIDTQAKKLYRSLKGNINIPNLIKYIESQGYSVVFIESEEGQAILKALNLDPGTKTAFSVSYDTHKYVFIYRERDTSSKIISLLHECGHIVLGHVEEIDLLDGRTIETEAETFVYTVLNYRENNANKYLPLFIAGGALMLIQGVKLYNLKRARRAEG